MILTDINKTIEQVSKLNISNIDSDVFNCAVVILWAVENKTWNTKRIIKLTGFKKEFIYSICGNLRNAGLLDFELKLEGESIIDITLAAMVAAGELKINT